MKSYSTAKIHEGRITYQSSATSLIHVIDTFEGLLLSEYY